MKYATLLALAASAVDAFPFVANSFGQPARPAKREVAQPGCTTSTLCDTYIDITDEEANIPSTDNALVQASQARTNCGLLSLCTSFDAADQYVSNTGEYAYASPGVTDIRGPCPGLNAAANHGYIPRNGLLNTEQTIDGLGAMYGMSNDLALFLAVYSIAFDGDLVTGTWSIGGPIPASALGSLLIQPQGDGYSHNNYEGDTSITRCDAYTNGGDAHSSSTTRFQYAYESGMEDDSYTLDTMSRLYAKNTHRSIQTNEYYFAPLFSTTLVSPAAYNFVINFMSNHSAESPGGYLNGAMFQTFFGMSGTYPDFTWEKGQEQLPDNWYRRPSTQEYAIADVFGDLIPEFLAYPDSFRFGGNVDGVNTYTGIDIANITNGLYDIDTLFEGDNLACFFFQNEQQAIPQQLQGGVNDVAQALSLITDNFGSFLTGLSCPQLGQYESDIFTPFTGNAYKPTAPTSGPVNC